MYLNYFNLREEPFSITPDPKFLLWSQRHESAAEALYYGIEQRKGFLLLTGEVGTGKTTLCRELVGRLDSKTPVSVILNPFLSVAGVLEAINADFGNRVMSASAEQQLKALNWFLVERARLGHNAVVLIDEAQNLSIDALEMTRLLSNLETDKQKLLQIVLVGQPELEATLASHRLRQLNQRISIRQRLGALTYAETKDYVLHRLRVANGGNIEFSRSAFKAIYRYSKGYPRVTNILCDRALLAAFSKRTMTIDKKIVREAIADLNGQSVRPWWRFWSCPSY